MNTKTEDRAIQALAASRPTADDLGNEWYIGRRERVLGQILAAPEAGGDSLTPQRTKSGARRWGLVAAAVAVVAASGLFVQTLLPVGSPGSPQRVEALEALARAVPEAGLPADKFELTVTRDSGVSIDESGAQLPYASTRSTWIASDGWSWAHQTGNDPAYYIFAPAERPYDLQAVPPDPAAMEAYLRARVQGSTSVDEAMYEAVQDQLMFTLTSPATRAAAIRMLGRIEGTSVTEGAADPSGRPSTKVAFVDEQKRPGEVKSMFFNPEDSQLLATTDERDGSPVWTSVYVERRVVDAIPEEILKVLGSKRTEKIVP